MKPHACLCKYTPSWWFSNESVGIYGNSISDDKQITYILTEDQIRILVHFKYFRVWDQSLRATIMKWIGRKTISHTEELILSKMQTCFQCTVDLHFVNFLLPGVWSCYTNTRSMASLRQRCRHNAQNHGGNSVRNPCNLNGSILNNGSGSICSSSGLPGMLWCMLWEHVYVMSCKSITPHIYFTKCDFRHAVQTNPAIHPGHSAVHDWFMNQTRLYGTVLHLAVQINHVT